MSYTLTIPCGCSVYVSCNPHTRVAHARIVERRGTACPTRRHVVGARVWLWELLPDPSCTLRALVYAVEEGQAPALVAEVAPTAGPLRGTRPTYH